MITRDPYGISRAKAPWVGAGVHRERPIVRTKQAEIDRCLRCTLRKCSPKKCREAMEHAGE